MDGLQLNGVQGKGHGVLDLPVAGQLGLIGGLPHSRVRVIGQIPDGGEVGDAVLVIHLHRTGEIGLQISPGIGSGQLHPGHNVFSLAA